MALPVQPGDIAIALHLIFLIKQNCLGPENQIDYKYRALKERVDEFEQALGRLEEVKDRLNRRSSSATGRLLSPAEPKTQVDFKTYRITLQKCSEFLAKHAHREGKSSNIFRTIKWTLNEDRQIEDFEKRIHDHYISALVHIGTAQLAPEVTPEAITPPVIADAVPLLSEEWRSKFRSSLRLDDSIGKDVDIENIPIDEAKEALYRHVTRSQSFDIGQNDHISSGYTSSAIVWLHLMKAQFLIETAERSQRLATAPEDARYFNDAKRQIADQRRSLVLQPSEDELLAEWLKEPGIWLKHVDTTVSSNVDATPQIGVTILRLRLSNQGRLKDELRITKIQDRFLRLHRHQDIDSSRSNTSETDFRLHEDRMIPQYVLNPHAGLILSKTFGDRVEFLPSSRKDTLSLQTAFTGYYVCWPRQQGHRVGMDILLGKTLGQTAVAGQVQLWNWPVPEVASPESGRQMMSPASSQFPASPLSPRSFTSSTSSAPTSLATAVTQRLQSSIHTYQFNETSRTGCVAGEMPPVPLIVAFICERQSYQIWRIELTETNLEITEGLNSLKIKSRQNNKLPVRRLAIRGAADLDSWNLCAISLPDHPDFNDDTVVERLRAKWICLTFTSETIRADFQKSLGVVLTLRAEQEAALRRSRQAFRNMGRRLQHTVVRSYS